MVIKNIYHGALNIISDELATKLMYFRGHKRFPNLNDPKSFSELVCCEKLLWNDSRFVDLTDKVKVKDWVASKLGTEWVIPTLYSGPHLDVDFCKSINGPYVIKANHGSGMQTIVHDASSANWSEIKSRSDKWLRTSWPRAMKENWYNLIDRKILIEPFIGVDKKAPPPDYKFFVFSGEVFCIQVDLDRFSEHRRDIYDVNWNILPFTLKYKNSGRIIEQPDHFSEMISAARVLGKEFKFCRVDFYSLPDGPKFGEITFAPESGFGKIDPVSFDYALGDVWLKSVQKRQTEIL